MARDSAYFKEIERLIDIGYDPKTIIKLTGIPSSTVYRLVDKLRVESRHDFSNLMEKDYLWKYMANLENFSKTIQECNEKMVAVEAKYDTIEQQINDAIEALEPKQAMTKATLLNNLITLQSARTNEMIKLVAQRDKATDMKAKVFNAGPVVYALDDWVRKGNIPQGTEPALILNKPPPLNNTEPISEDMPIIDEEDKEIIRKMEEEQ